MNLSLGKSAVLVLLYTKYFGKSYQGDVYILRQQLTRMLKAKFSYTDGDVSKLMLSLHTDGLIVRALITPRERVDLFGSRGGTQVVILNAKGNQKIEDFRNAMAQHAERWLDLQSKKTGVMARSLQRGFDVLARLMIKKHGPTVEAESGETDD